MYTLTLSCGHTGSNPKLMRPWTPVYCPKCQLWVGVTKVEITVDLGPTTNELTHWVRKLVHADSGDSAIVALAELRKLEKRFPK